MNKKCMYHECKKDAEIAVHIEDKEIYLCKRHYKQLNNLLKKYAVIYGNSSLNVLKIKKYGSGIIFTTDKNIDDKTYKSKSSSLKRVRGLLKSELGIRKIK